MHVLRFVLLAGAASAFASPVAALETLKFGPAPTWVTPQTIPNIKPTDAPVAILLSDQQVTFERGKTISFVETVMRIQNSQGLSAGNISFNWDPARDTVTVNKLQIRRGDQVIDVLAAGQTFTILRRESNLELAMFDGTLTANIQPEGLQEGDIVDFATTAEHSDPVFKDHVETLFAPWDSTQIGLGHAKIAWPSNLDVKIRTTGDVGEPKQAMRSGDKTYELTLPNIEPVIRPKSAPLRYQIGRLGEATDFDSWADAAALVTPLFEAAAKIPPKGPLRDEVDKIREASSDTRARAELALQLVEQRIRYVALLMGQGGYVPATAEETWSRRFGDCKAKTALLLAILHEFGIEAEPVLVNPQLGDAISDRLPMLALFNHVLVRARIAGKTYWLDGTRTGDTSLDLLEVPDFGWGLPLVQNAQLVHLAPAALVQPSMERQVNVDASGGVFAPAPITISELYRGDAAVQMNVLYSSASASQRDELARKKAESYFDGFDFKSSSYLFDKAKRELTVSIQGSARLAWDDNGWLYIPTSSIAFDPDFERPSGPFREAPIALDHPRFVKDVATLKLPPGFARQQKLDPAVNETLAGVEYARTEAVNGDVLTVTSSERSLASEIPYAAAIAAKARLKSLSDDDSYLRLVDYYRPSQTDLAALTTDKPVSKKQFFRRGLMFSQAGRFDEAIGDFSEALKLDPKDAWTLANRGIAYVWKREFEKGQQDIDAASAIDARNPVNLRAAGLLAELKSDPARAVEFYTRSLQVEPNNGFALQHRALALQMQGKTGQAIADLDKTVRASPADSLLLASSAYSKAMLGKYDEAENDLKAAEAIDPSLPSTLGVRAVIAEGRHDYKTAVAIYTKVLKQAPNDAYSLLHRGLAYQALGDPKNALADSEAALKRAENTSEIRLLRANIFKQQGNRDSAIAEADLMTRENPNSEYAFVAGGRIYDAFGLRDKALKAFDRALAIKTESYIYVNRAQVRRAADDAARMADLDAAIKLDPYNADALGMKAWELTKSGQYASALEIYDRAIQISSDDGGLAIGKAIALYKSGNGAEAERILSVQRAQATTGDDYHRLCIRPATAGVLLEQALVDCRKARELNSNINPESEGFVLLRLGRFDEAVTTLSNAIEKSHDAYAYMARGIAYQRKGDKKRASADRAEALKLDADIEARLASYGVKF